MARPLPNFLDIAYAALDILVGGGVVEPYELNRPGEHRHVKDVNARTLVAGAYRDILRMPVTRIAYYMNYKGRNHKGPTKLLARWNRLPQEWRFQWDRAVRALAIYRHRPDGWLIPLPDRIAYGKKLYEALPEAMRWWIMPTFHQVRKIELGDVKMLLEIWLRERCHDPNLCICASRRLHWLYSQKYVRVHGTDLGGKRKRWVHVTRKGVEVIRQHRDAFVAEPINPKMYGDAA